MAPLRVILDLPEFQALLAGKIANTTTFVPRTFTPELGDDYPVEIILKDIGYDAMLTSIQSQIIHHTREIIDLDNDQWLTLLDDMEEYGGSFVKQLAAMARRADRVNKVKCIITWSPYFLQYHNFK